MTGIEYRHKHCVGLIDFWDVFFSFSIKKRIWLPRLDQDFKKFTQFHSIHEFSLTWSRSKSFLAQNTSYHIHMRNIAYRCDTKVTNLNRSTKKHTQYYVYIRFNAYTCNTVMQLQNKFFKLGWACFVHWNSSIAYICATHKMLPPLCMHKLSC